MEDPSIDRHIFTGNEDRTRDFNLTFDDATGNMVFSEHQLILRKDITDTEWTTGKAFLVVFMSIINVFMCFGNILSILTICSTPALRTQVSYWFVLNLAVIDFVISVTVVPLNTVWEYYGVWPLSETTCEFFTFADISFSTISAYSIVLVSVDKYLYISYSIHYHHKMTRKLGIILIITVWILVFAFATVSILTEVGTEESFRDHFLHIPNNTHNCVFVMTDAFVLPSATLCFFVPLMILCFTSTKIICIASKHIRKIHTMSVSIGETESDILRTATAIQNPVKRRNTLSGFAGSIDGNSLKKNSYCKQISSKATSDKTVSIQDSTKSTISNISSPQEATKTDNYNGSDHANIQFEIQSDDENKDLKDNNKTTEYNCAVKELPVRIPIVTKSRSFSMRSDIIQTSNCGKSLSRRTSPYCKLFGTVTIVIACFIVMFAPYNIAIVIDVPCHCIEPWVYEDILAVLYYMHSLVNPYIYMATDRKYKAALKILFRRIRTMLYH